MREAETDILYIGFLLGHGGDANQMLGLASGMAKLGRSVRMVVPDLPTTVDFAERCCELGIEAIRSSLLRASAHSARQSLPALLKLMSSYRAPIVHYHTGDICLPRLALLAHRLLRLPRAFATVHGAYETLEPGSSRAKMWALGVDRQFHAVVCPSENGRQNQLRLGVPGSRLSMIHNGIDVERFGGRDGKGVRDELGIGKETPLVVFTSRLDAQKRPMDALMAFVGIAEEFPSAHLVFAGKGEEMEALRLACEESGIENRIHFVGFRNDIPAFLAAATVWILPTETENFSLSVLEALAAGCPILSTQCPGNNEILRDGDNALLTAVGDIPAQIRALRSLLSDVALRQRLGESARLTAQSHGMEAMIARYAALYSEAARP